MVEGRERGVEIVAIERIVGIHFVDRVERILGINGVDGIQGISRTIMIDRIEDVVVALYFSEKPGSASASVTEGSSD